MTSPDKSKDAPQKTAEPTDRSEDTSQVSTSTKHLAHTPKQKRARLREVGHKLATSPGVVEAGEPVGNWASRDNIVADGPGTVADFIVADSDKKE